MRCSTGSQLQPLGVLAADGYSSLILYLGILVCLGARSRTATGLFMFMLRFMFMFMLVVYIEVRSKLVIMAPSAVHLPLFGNAQIKC